MINELSGDPPLELVIGVDFGMTQTGVVYCFKPWNNPKTFQHWSGNVNEIANKVPSRLGYDINTGELRSWGFNCDIQDPTLDIFEHFKLYLDPEYHDDYADFTYQDAQRYFYDFLFHVHKHISNYFSRRFPRWSLMKVEWVFSVPTTWRDAALINSLEQLIRSAGFGDDGLSHTCRITLTEAEAAAISVAGQYLEKDDVVLVCDAGGGTTDINVLRVVSPKGHPLRLQPLSKMEGQPIGSALIDIRVQQLLERYLQNIAQLLPMPPAEMAELMMVGRFERFKCNFGAPGTNIPYLLLDVPGLAPGTNIPAANVVNSQIAITSETLKMIFDEQVDALVSFVDQHIREVHYTRPGERVDYIILSGGLGSSAYVQDRLRYHFNEAKIRDLPAAERVHILAAEEPQLSVVNGLVLERAQQISVAINPIANRNARVSYGVVVNRIYKPGMHKGESVQKDDRDGKKWAIDQIEWLVRESDQVPIEGISKRFRAKIDPDQLRQPWHAHFVMSTLPAAQLPASLAHPDVRTICVLQADIANTHRMVRNGHWWNFSRRYELAAIDVRVIPGSADLKFEIWNEGRRLDGAHDNVEVHWENKLANNAPVGNTYSNNAKSDASLDT